MVSNLNDVLVGLVSATIAAIIAASYRRVRRARLDRAAMRRHPIGGAYASSYTDEVAGQTRTTRDEVRIVQHGVKFTGVSRNLESGRRFRFEGSIVDDKHLVGTYGGDHRADGASGVFFMALELLETGKISGIWTGFGAESGVILSGEWRWRRLSLTEVVDARPGDDYSRTAAAILNDALGSGFVPVADIEELAGSDDGIVLYAMSPTRDVVGVATAQVMSEETKADLLQHFEAADIRRSNLSSQKVGLLKSAAVIRSARGSGIGLSLVNERLMRLRQLDCTVALVLAWDSGGPHSSIGVLEAAGFSRIGEIRNFWQEPEGRETFDCIRCGRPCRCSAIVMRRSLYDFTLSAP